MAKGASGVFDAPHGVAGMTGEYGAFTAVVLAGIEIEEAEVPKRGVEAGGGVTFAQEDAVTIGGSGADSVEIDAAIDGVEDVDDRHGGPQVGGARAVEHFERRAADVSW